MSSEPAGRIPAKHVTGLPEMVEAGRLPRHVGRYQAHEVLGRGAMGIVYRGRDPMLQRDVAIKVMGTSIVADDVLRARLEREARAIARLAHPNLVTVFDLGYEDDAPYVVMELLRGRDLADVLSQREPLALERKLDILLQVLAGLAHVHRAGIVHRDVKPGNIFLTEDGRVRLLDFGMARFLDASSHSSSVMGTADYMSPEQLEGQAVDGRSDLFACGAMLFELLTGWAPFHAENVPTIAYRVVHKEPDYGLLPAEGAALRPVLEKALSKDVGRRYASAAEFARALVAEAGLPASMLPADLAAGALTTALGDERPGQGPHGAGPGERMTDDLRTRRSPWRPATVTALIAMLGFVALWGVVRLGPRGSSLAPSTEPSHLEPAQTAAPVASMPGARPRREGRAPAESERDAPRQAEVSRPEPAPADGAGAPETPPAVLQPRAEAARANRLIAGRWEGYVTDDSCKGRGAVNDHWECVQVCMRKGYRPMLEVDGTFYYLAGVERIRGERNRHVVVEGTLDTVTRTITVSTVPVARDRS